ncbi:MAG: LysR substrate-binding domain-containing protein [Rhodoferax sp.]
MRLSATNGTLDMVRSQIDVAVRFTRPAGQGEPLFEETVMPVCAPALLCDRRRPLRTPADLVHHTLLAMEMPQDTTPTADWSPRFQIMGLPEMPQALRFSQYADAVAAAVAGQGVAIGRLPLVAELLREGGWSRTCAAPSARAYFVLASPRAERMRRTSSLAAGERQGSQDPEQGP